MFCDSVCVQYYRKHTVTVTVTSLCKCRLLYPELFIEPGAGAGTAGTLLSAGHWVKVGQVVRRLQEAVPQWWRKEKYLQAGEEAQAE